MFKIRAESTVLALAGELQHAFTLGRMITMSQAFAEHSTGSYFALRTTLGATGQVPLVTPLYREGC